MRKKIIGLLTSSVLVLSSVLVPVVASAEAHATYITNSDFTDCAVGGATGQGYYGLSIIMDGSPWLSKGSARLHAETYLHDDERNVNYCNFYSNSDKSGTGDGAGSMYVYQRDSTQNFTQTYGYAQFDVRVNSGSFALMLGSFLDATSSTDYLANTVTFTSNSINVHDGGRSVTVANISPEKWYTVKIVTDNDNQEVNISVTNVETGKVIGTYEEASYQDLNCTSVRTWCFGYIRGNQYNYDLTNVTISKTDDSKNPFSI